MECDHEEYMILKERGRQITAKCLECGEVFTFLREKSIAVPVVINRRENSQKSTVRLERGTSVRKGDIIEVDGEEIEVHAIEVGNKRVDKESAEAIDTIWGVSISYPKVIGVSIHTPKATLSYKVIAQRDEIYKIGDVYQVGNMSFEVTAMITESGKRKSAYGDEIKRLYGNPSTRLARELLEVYDGS